MTSRRSSLCKGHSRVGDIFQQNKTKWKNWNVRCLDKNKLLKFTDDISGSLVLERDFTNS